MAPIKPLDLLLAFASALRLCGGVDGVGADAADCNAAEVSTHAANEADLDGVCFRLARAL